MSAVELLDGVLRVTFPLPFGIDHVHCYLLRGADGWMLVDTGLGLDAAERRWQPILGRLDGPLERIVVTHFHPDHVGGSADVADLAGAPVFQGRLDHEQCVRAWSAGWPRRITEFVTENGMPQAEAERGLAGMRELSRMIRYAPEPEPLEPGDRVAGWEVLHLPGHADGHLVLLRDGVLLAGDVLLAGISPAVGLYPASRPDPLGDFLASLARLVELAPRIAFAGHGLPIEDPAGRARELIEHHRERLARTVAALGREAKSAYEVSLELFPAELPSAQRRFALAESLAHLERLVREGRVERIGTSYRTA